MCYSWILRDNLDNNHIQLFLFQKFGSFWGGKQQKLKKDHLVWMCLYLLFFPCSCMPVYFCTFIQYHTPMYLTSILSICASIHVIIFCMYTLKENVFVCLGIFVPIFFLPNIGPHGHWAVRFFSMPHLLWHGSTFYNGHIWGPVTLTPIVELLVVEMSLPVFKRLGSIMTGIEPLSPACDTNSLPLHRHGGPLDNKFWLENSHKVQAKGSLKLFWSKFVWPHFHCVCRRLGKLFTISSSPPEPLG